MNCEACGQDNPDANRFCGGCGAALARACPACGHANPSDHRFCGSCGAKLQGVKGFGGSGLRDSDSPLTPNPLAPNPLLPRHLAEKILGSRAALEGERKQVTVLFADVKGSMELAEQLDPEEWSGIMSRFFRILSEGVERFEGFVDKFTGDGIMALFGAPIAHEDHAQRACYAALHLRAELRGFAQELRRQRGLDFATRLGINSGEVVVGKIGDDLSMEYTAQGHTVGLAQRMEALAEAGRIYLTAATARRVEGFFTLEDLGEFNVKGARAPVQAYALDGLGRLRTRFDRSRARGLSRFVGRDEEMRLLETALARAEQGHGQVIAVVAPAGTGKSRLCFELLERCRVKGLAVLEAQALAHGRSIPLRPILEMFRRRFGIGEHDTDLAAREKTAGALLLLDPSFAEMLPAMFEFLGVPDPARPAPRMDPEAARRRILDSFRRIVLADTRDRTVVTLIEDLHWLDDASDRFVGQLVELAPATRGLVLLNFRPEYAAAWTNRSAVQQIVLQPLGPEAVRAMLAGLIGSDPTVAGLPEIIHARTSGNPFFAEEIVQALIEDGSLTGTAGAYRLTRAIEKVPLPETVQNVLAARIDHLQAREKHVLQTAAVIGRDLPRALLAAVCEIAGGELDEALAVLRGGEFLFETALYPQIEYTFKHPLTHEVAYQSQLAHRRATIHRAVATEMEALYAERLDERAAEIAWHWEAAGEREAAARWHLRAAEWAERRDLREAMKHWRAAYDLLPEVPGDPAGAEQLVHLCQRLLLFGGVSLGLAEDETTAIFERGLRAAGHHGDIGGRVRVSSAYANSCLTRGRLSEFLRQARENVRLADESRDGELRAVALLDLAVAEGFVGNWRDSDRVLDEFFRAAPVRDDLSGWSASAFAHAWRGTALFSTGRMTEAADSFARAQQIAESADPLTQVLVGATVMVFGVMRGELPGAIELAARMARVAEEFGATNLRVSARSSLARTHGLLGEWKQAVRLFEEALALANEHHVYLENEADDLAALGHAYVEVGRPERAKEAAERGLALARAQGSKLYEVLNLGALSRAETALGHYDTVEPLLVKADALISAMGAVAYSSHLAEIRAELARRRGDGAGWRAFLTEAHRLFAETGATGHAARVARILEGQSG